MIKSYILSSVFVAALLGVFCVVSVSPVFAGSSQKNFRTPLTGFQEVPPIASDGEGSFNARLNKEGTELAYELSYSGMDTPVTQVHIHFAQKGVNGGVFAFLCSNIGGPTDVACPAPPEGKVEGTLTAANILTIVDQDVTEGDFDDFLKALRNGTAYVNVHTEAWVGGELRGQIGKSFFSFFLDDIRTFRRFGIR